MSQRRAFTTSIASLTTIGLVFSTLPVAYATEENGTISVSVTNFTDFHGNLTENEGNGIMGASKLASLMNQLEADSDLQIRTTSGDNVGGTAAISAVSNDQPTLDVLNAMDIDVSAVGNHEFDAGFDDLQERIIPGSDYPILGANVIDTTTGEPALDPSYIIEEGTLSIGFVGTVTDLTPAKVSPTAVAGLEFIDPVEAANKEATRLKQEEDVDLVVVLQHEDIVSHSRFNDDVDVAFGGDSHQRHFFPQDMRAQAWEYGKALNEFTFTYDPATDEVSDVALEQYLYEDLPAATIPDQAVDQVVAEAGAKFEIVGAEVLTTLEEPMLRGTAAGVSGRSENRGVESTANNMLADSAKWAINDFLGREVAEIGIMNAGGVRSDLQAGEVTYAEALTMQPFGNEIGYAVLSGAAFKEALENQWNVDPAAGRPRLSLGVSENVTYAFDPEKPRGERIINVHIDGEPLDLDRDYTIAGASFLFDGGDGYINTENVKEVTYVGLLDITAFSDYLRAEGNPVYRGQQHEIGISGLDNLVAGETATLELSALGFSNETEQRASEVTLKLGDTTATAPVSYEDPTTGALLGSIGNATVELEVPANLSGSQTLEVTLDDGTVVPVIVDIESTSPSPDEGNDDTADSDNNEGTEDTDGTGGNETDGQDEKDKTPEQPEPSKPSRGSSFAFTLASSFGPSFRFLFEFFFNFLRWI